MTKMRLTELRGLALAQQDDGTIPIPNALAMAPVTPHPPHPLLSLG